MNLLAGWNNYKHGSSTIMTRTSSISIVHLNVLEKELEILKYRNKSESIVTLNSCNDVVVDYFERRIKELNEYND